MSELSSIKDHSGRVYSMIQALVVAAVGAAVVALFAGDHSTGVGWALFTCAVAMAGCGAGLSYLRRSITYRLDRARRAEEERQHLLAMDQITGTMTRRFFLERLQETIGRAVAPNEVTLLLVDLDHFKQINDSYGHQCGDNALARLGAMLNELFPEAIVGRLGGDEFAVALAHADRDRLPASAALLQERLAEGLHHAGMHIPLSASIGIAHCPEHADCPEGLMHTADLALYQSKEAGRSRATVFDPDMTAEQRHRRTVERELRAAIYLDELELHYQPVVDARGQAVGAEALVRWRHSFRGLISPASFIPFAERSRLIDMLGEWVFRRACRDAPLLGDLTIAINVSSEQLKRDEVVAMMTRVLAETGVAASRFVVEITETAAMDASTDALGRLVALRRLGFRIALDDFGTGHCGFNYLTALPIDVIKVDRSYVRDLAGGGIAPIFVSALAQIAALRDLQIVAEGVETELEMIAARTAGCHRFQGYKFGRPVGLPAFRRMLEGQGIPAGASMIAA